MKQRKSLLTSITLSSKNHQTAAQPGKERILMVRSALLASFGVATTAFFSFWAIVSSFFNDAENNIHKVVVIWSRLMLRICRVKVEVSGLDNPLPGKPQVFMANHRSDLDILIALAHLPGRLRWVAKKELFSLRSWARL